MEMNYVKQYSPALGRDMECKIYGHGGRPVLYIPCQDGRFFDFENFHMHETWAPWIDRGDVIVFAIDTIDRETWSDANGDPYWRIRRYEQWIRYITDEMVPFMRKTVNDRNGWTGYPDVIAFGCSLGATHASNLYFRRPDLFDGVLALSGVYSASYGFGDYMDDIVYINSPVDISQTCRKIIRILNSTIRKMRFSVPDRDRGRFRSPQDSSNRFWSRNTLMRGWITGVTMSPMTGRGGTSRWNILCRIS